MFCFVWVFSSLQLSGDCSSCYFLQPWFWRKFWSENGDEKCIHADVREDTAEKQ